MGLIIPPPSWANCTTNLTGTPPGGGSASFLGTSVTSGGSVNTDGSTVSLIAALGHDCEYLIIELGNSGASAVNTSMLLDIMIDPAGGTAWNTNPLINDLLAGFLVAATQGVSITGNAYYFPIWIKSGTSIGARVRCATATRSVAVAVYAFGGNAQPSSWWCGQDVTTIAVTAASSIGTLHTAGSTGAFSAWTNLGSTTPAPCGAVQFGVQGCNSTTMTPATGYFFEFGVGSTRIGPNKYVNVSTAESTVHSRSGGPIFCELPTGTQLQVRGTCQAAAQAMDVAAWVVH